MIYNRNYALTSFCFGCLLNCEVQSKRRCFDYLKNCMPHSQTSLLSDEITNKKFMIFYHLFYLYDPNKFLATY